VRLALLDERPDRAGIDSKLARELEGVRDLFSKNLIPISRVTALERDAARLEGETWVKFRHVIIPMARNATFTVILLSFIGGLRSFDLIWAMTKGGPGFGTTTLEFFVYQSAFSQGQFGTGALYGIILFVIMITVGLVQLRLIRSEDGEGW
jgi:ABC-type sugar transport system permease subunit